MRKNYAEKMHLIIQKTPCGGAFNAYERIILHTLDA